MLKVYNIKILYIAAILWLFAKMVLQFDACFYSSSLNFNEDFVEKIP